MKKIYLDGKWNIKNSKIGSLPANVPGCVHTDLISNKVIKDIFWRDSNREYQWIENEDWDYQYVFDSDVDNNVSLVFEGLDTYAEVYLNGVKLGETNDMFIPYRFDVSSVLMAKENILQVHFRSPIKKIENLPLCNGAFTRERLRTRRLQCTYSWDWVDRFVTCGIYRPVYLEYENGIDIDSVYIYTENLDSFSAQVCVEFYFKNYDRGAIAHVDIISPDGAAAAYTDMYVDREKMVCRFDIVEPHLWYPNGYGEQPLYLLKVTVGDNTHVENFGIRTLKILQIQDKKGEKYWKKAQAAEKSDAGKKYAVSQDYAGFQVVVNGVKIFCKGGNWVPCEPFPSNESDEKIRRLVNMAKDMGANFLRVWGGGLFEKKSFYDECDKCGILVAQDFLMACGEYPDKEQWFIDLLTKESEFATKYLRNHPCLAWYHGDNENATRGSDIKSDYIGRSSALDGILPQVYKNDHTHQLLPSSPYGGNTYACITKGTSHTTKFLGMIFDYFVYDKCSDYKEYMEQFVSRFISEEGVFGAITRPSMLKFMTQSDLLNDEKESMIIYHTRTNPNMKNHIFKCVRDFAEKVLGDYIDSEDRFFKYKFIQYEWTRISFENVRRNLGYCNGLVFWMYNDCWPAALGWSFVDYYLLPKHSYYSFLRGAKHIIGSVIPKNDRYAMVISTDNQTFTDVLVKSYLVKKGKVIDTYSTVSKTLGYGTVEIDIPYYYDDEAIIICDIEYENGNDRCFYKEGALTLCLCDRLLEVVEKKDDSIVLKANGYIHVVELEGEYIFEDNCFQMLEGEIRTLKFNKLGDSEFTLKAYTIAQ